MKLFYHPGACSLAVHIALIEAGLPFELVRIDRDKRTGDGRDFLSINPHGFVPTLEFDDGMVLSEALANLCYVAGHATHLLPEQGPTRWRVLETLSFMTTELHGHFKPLWKRAPDAEQAAAKQSLTRHFSALGRQLGDAPYIAAPRITIADPYLFVMLRWASAHGIDVPANLAACHDRLRALPPVAQALSEEGL